VEEAAKPVDGIRRTVAGKNKRAYEQPLLKRFGSAKMLTTGGSGKHNEGGQTSPTTCAPPNSFPHKICY
jgi:hypothetical protein